MLVSQRETETERGRETKVKGERRRRNRKRRYEIYSERGVYNRLRRSGKEKEETD
jgi:hypothetical protein